MEYFTNELDDFERTNKKISDPIFFVFEKEFFRLDLCDIFFSGSYIFLWNFECIFLKYHFLPRPRENHDATLIGGITRQFESFNIHLHSLQNKTSIQTLQLTHFNTFTNHARYHLQTNDNTGKYTLM
jgi:hypothetical protein